jgi:triacylglycerol lipase
MEARCRIDQIEVSNVDKHRLIQDMERAALAYQPVQPRLGGQRLAVIDDRTTDVQCFLCIQGDELLIAFRGSDSKKDWHTNFLFCKKGIPYGNDSSKIRVHTGFLNAYKSPGVRGKIHGFVTPEIRRIRITGHSLGAALAVLCAVDLQYNFPDRDYEAALFGCPRVGNRAFAESYNRRVFKTLRVENGNDIVTRVPLRLMGYWPVGTLIHVGERRGLKLSFRQHRPEAYYQKLFIMQ